MRDEITKEARRIVGGILLVAAAVIAVYWVFILVSKPARTATPACGLEREAWCFPAALGRPTEGREVMRSERGRRISLPTASVAAPRPSTSNTAGATLLAYGSDEVSTRRRIHRSSWARPHRWCGWYMRKIMGVSDPRFNLARNWRDYGRPAYGPAPGVIVVWRGHVGKIVGPCQGRVCMVHSGNDGRAVRTRLRSVARAIAFRWPA